MDSHKNHPTFSRRKHTAALVFALAVLMLVVSCPFKRLLQNDTGLQASTQRSVKWNHNNERNTAAYNTSCCSLKQKITLVQTTNSKQQLPSPDFFTTQNQQTGFAINYYLSGTEKIYSTSTAVSLSSLPLFLQHRRLLI